VSGRGPPVSDPASLVCAARIKRGELRALRITDPDLPLLTSPR